MTKWIAVLLLSLCWLMAYAEKTIVIDLSEQELYCYEDGDLVKTYHVSTGKKGYRTPVGKSTVLAKIKVGRAKAKYGGGKMPWQMRIRSDGISIHGYKSVPSYPASHGCIRVKPDEAKEIYEWTPKGTKVTVRK